MVVVYGDSSDSDMVLPEVCSAHARNFPAFCFLTIVVQNVVQVPWLPDVTEGHMTPKRVPLGARMRNRQLRNICPSRGCSQEVTSFT